MWHFYCQVMKLIIRVFSRYDNMSVGLFGMHLMYLACRRAGGACEQEARDNARRDRGLVKEVVGVIDGVASKRV